MNWRQPVLIFVLIIAFFAVFSPNAFALVKKFIPVNSGREEALKMFNMAQTEFRNGNIFQAKKEYEEAVECYAASLCQWRTMTGYYNLAKCLLALKKYDVAEWSAIRGLEISNLKDDFVNLGSFMVLLGNIYYESGNIEKAKDAYNFALRLPISEECRSFIEERMEKYEFQ
ncbi:MAG: hypothetical protein HW401_729 [Parcubacteria group bacterium]|nr:hypothetical protein [Parcubacteria group bacterium]